MDGASTGGTLGKEVVPEFVARGRFDSASFEG
jgi:hypothetical protein